MWGVSAPWNSAVGAHPTLQMSRRFFGVPVSVSASGHGTMALPHEFYYIGETITLAAEPEIGWYVKNYTLDGEPLAGDTFIVSKAHTVSAVFGAAYRMTVAEDSTDVLTVPTYAIPGEALTICAAAGVTCRLYVNGSYLATLLNGESMSYVPQGNCTFSAERFTFTAGGNCGSNTKWYLTDSGELVICGTGDMGNYRLDNVPWYSLRTEIKTVTVESGVTSIGNNAFSGCQNLTSVELPDGITSIGYGVFYGCSSLTDVNIPDSVTDTPLRQSLRRFVTERRSLPAAITATV